MKHLDRRLDRVFGKGRGLPCPECVGEPPKGAPVEYEVYWPEIDGEEESGPTHCPECGRRLVIEVTWSDPTQGKENP